VNPDIVSPLLRNLRLLDRTFLGLKCLFHSSEKTAVTCVIRCFLARGGCHGEHGEYD
jgi:hypothetical protein